MKTRKRKMEMPTTCRSTDAFFTLVLLLAMQTAFAELKYEDNWMVPKLTGEEKQDAPDLSGAGVYPEWGVPCTNFTYTVVYRDPEGRPPAYMRIWLNGQWRDMNYLNGEYESGARYVYPHIPVSGTSNFYYFEASNGAGKARAGIIDSPDQGPMIYSQKFDNNQIILLNKKSSQPVWVMETGNDMVSDVAIARGVNRPGNESYIAAATFTSIYLFSSNSSRPLWRFCTDCSDPPIARTDYRGVAISADGNYIAGSLGSRLYLFKTESNVPVWSADIESNAIGVDISDDGAYIAAGVGNAESRGDKIFFFSRESNQPLWEYKAEQPGYEQTGNFYRPDLTAAGDRVAVSTGCPDRRAYVFSRDGSMVLQSERLTFDSPIHKSAISDDGRISAYSADHAQGKEILFVFDDEGRLLWNFSSPADATARAVSVSGDGNYIATGTSAGNLYFFSSASSEPLWKFSVPGSFSQIGDIKLSSTGDLLAVGGAAKKIYLFSRESSTPLWEYGASTWINAIDFNDEYLVAGTGLLEYKFEGSDMSEEEVACTTIIQPPPMELVMGGSGGGIGEDSDEPPVCRDMLCEPSKGENYESCPEDCIPPGYEDTDFPELIPYNPSSVQDLEDLEEVGYDAVEDSRPGIEEAGRSDTDRENETADDAGKTNAIAGESQGYSERTKGPVETKTDYLPVFVGILVAAIVAGGIAWLRFFKRGG